MAQREQGFNRLVGRGARGMFVSDDASQAFSSEPFDTAQAPELMGDGWYRLVRPLGGSPELPGATGPMLIRLGRENGRVVITGLVLLSDSAIAVRDLARLPLRSIAATYERHPVSVDRAPELVKEPRRPGRRGRPDEFYEQVAQLYRIAVAEAPTKPVQWIANRMTGGGSAPSLSTVHRWLKAARERGLLDKENDDEQ